MRRLPLLTAVILLIAVSASAVEPWNESNLRERRPAWTRGEAMIVQPAHPLTDADREELAARGILIRQPLAGARFLARVAEGADLGDPRLSSVERLTPAMKLQRSAVSELERGASWIELNVVFIRDVTFEEARQAVLAAGGALAEVFATDFELPQRLAVKLPRVGLQALSVDERVLAISGPNRFRVESHNATSASVSKVNVIHDAPYDLTGEGVTVSLFELAAAQESHVEFGGRLMVKTEGGDGRHATHVAGTIGAAGVNPGAKGMAPKATIAQYKVTTGAATLASKRNDLPVLGVVADNNSWGYVLGWQSEDSFWVWNDLAQYYGAYELEVTAVLDQIANEKNILFVHSAGNDGSGPNLLAEWSDHRHVDPDNNYKTITDQLFCYSRNGSGTDCPAGCNGKPVGCETVKHHTSIPWDTMGMTASAKNVVAVGALAGATTSLAGFSSRGPAKDGRVKPDVVTRGTAVLSPVPTNNYGHLQGTSMAAPVVTGVAALLTEQWRRTFAGANPTVAQLKGLLIAGAEDLGNPGPDYAFGFGLVNAQSSVDLIRADEGSGKRIRNVSVAQGQRHELRVAVPSSQHLRLVLQWADPAIPFLNGDDIAAAALVNDLDLSVIDPSGTTQRPWKLDKDNYTANATRGINTVDNTEVVEIANAVPGVYRVVIEGTRIAEGPQKAVLLSSATVANPCVDLQEPNDSAGTAHGNLVSGQMVLGAICTQADLDFFKFEATKSGPAVVTINAGDTPLRATLTGAGLNVTVDVAAHGTATLNHNVVTAPFPMVLKLEATGSLGAEPVYNFVPEFGVTTPQRRRSAGR